MGSTGSEQRQNVMVIGNGATGTALASRLTLLQKNPLFVGRKGPIALKSRFEGWGKVSYLDIKPLAQADVSGVAIVFVTVKAFDLAGALERYLPYVPKGVPVIPLTNGAVEEVLFKVARKHPDYLWRIGLCTFGVTVVSEGIYSLRSQDGKIVWGPLERRRQRDRRLDAAIAPSPIEKEILAEDGGLFFQWQDYVIPAVRRKWLFNVVINSMTAALDIPRNGELLNDMPRLTQVFEEGYRLGLELWGAWDKSYDKLLEDLVCLISSTADNENSMARDVRLGRKTENEYLAKLAEGRRGYEQLIGLSQLIEKRTTSKGREILKKP